MILSNKKPKKQIFVLNDVIKRKILEMYKISTPEKTKRKTASKTKKMLKKINNSKVNSNTNWSKIHLVFFYFKEEFYYG